MALWRDQKHTPDVQMAASGSDSSTLLAISQLACQSKTRGPWEKRGKADTQLAIFRPHFPEPAICLQLGTNVILISFPHQRYQRGTLRRSHFIEREPRRD